MKFFSQLLALLFLLNAFWLWPNVTILNGLTHIHNTEKGLTFTGEIIIQNMSKEKSERVIIYLEDIKQDCAGETQYFEAGTLQRSINKWLRLSATEQVLSPDEKFSLVYTISIPKETVDEAIPDLGSFWGTVMVEMASPINEEDQYGVKINSKLRYGIQLIVNVATPETNAIEFVDVQLSKEESQSYALNVKLQNMGIFLVQPELTLELFNQFGESFSKTKVQSKKIYPDSCKDFKIPLTTLPQGSYDGVLVADYGETVYGINLELNTETAE